MNRLVTKLSMVVVVFALAFTTTTTKAFANDTKELCNKMDDDGDGLVDEDWPIGQSCWGGLGLCREQGVWLCGVSAMAICGTKQTAYPQNEVCNGLDDDCDGLVDNLNTYTCQVESELNPCGEGRIVCTPNGEHVCIPIPPTAEVCGNDLDEDCNGVAEICIGDEPEPGVDGGVGGLNIDTIKTPEPNLGDACRPVYLKNDGCSLSPPSPHPLLPISAVLVLIGGATLISRRRRLL